MRIIAFDPGETTGFVIAEVEVTTSIVKVEIKTLDEFTGLLELFNICQKLYEGWIDFVVIEDYIIYPNKAMSHAGSKVLAARTIGHIEFATMQFGLTKSQLSSGSHVEYLMPEIVFQTASMAKSLWPDKRLAKYLGKVSHLSNHKRDAIRHAFTWIERTHKLPLEILK